MTAQPPQWSPDDPSAFVDELFRWFESEGSCHYDECVTQLEHALQSAQLAQRAQDGDEAVAAALLHDIGHLLLREHEGQTTFLHQDLGHELVAARWLARMFPPGVTGPIAAHVRAKRYLCTTDPQYRRRLSRASERSFILQGGPLSADELALAERDPALEAALALRRRDDASKVSGRTVRPLASYRTLIESLLLHDQP